MELLTTLALAATLSIPARASATVSLAADGRIVAAAWSAATAEGLTDVYMSVSRDSGATFSGPVRVNATAGDARVNGEQPPRVVLVRRGSAMPSIVVVWASAATTGGKLLSARSDDGGRTFDSPAPVPGSDGAGNRGWQSATADGAGLVHALWLDHRGMAPSAAAGAAGAHAGHAASSRAATDSVAMAQRSALYTSIVGRPESVRIITTGVCYCCKTAMATGGNGELFAAWRQVYPGSVRDIAASVSKDGGRTFAPPIKVSDDGWVLNGCPDDGPALAIGKASAVHVVWPTVVTATGGAQTLQLFYATSADGRTFTPRQRIPTDGVPHHPQIAVAADGSVVIAWDESVNGAKRVAFAHGVPDATGRVQLARSPVAAAGAYPAVVSTADGVIAAWTSGTGPGTTIHVERIGPR